MQLIGRAGSGSTGDLGMNADTTKKLQGSLTAMKMIKRMKGAAKGLNNWGAPIKGVEMYTDETAFQLASDALAMRMVNAISGQAFTNEQLAIIKSRLPFYSDNEDTKVDKLERLRLELTDVVSSIGDVIPLDKQEEFQERFGDKAQAIKSF